MIGYQPGDVVDIVRRIDGATVTDINGTPGHIVLDVMWPGVNVSEVIDLADSTYTVTRRAPQPQAGDVWQLADGEILQFFMASGVLEADDPHDSGYSVPAADLDLTDAELLFRLDAAEPKPAGMLRRFRDGDRDLWTETAPGSGSYTCPAVDVGSTRRTRDQVADAYGRLVDLDPIPVELSAPPAGEGAVTP